MNFRLISILLVVLVFSCKKKDDMDDPSNPNNPPVITIDPTYSQGDAQGREPNFFRDSVSVTYSILLDDLPDSISQQDFETAVVASFNAWRIIPLNLRDGNNFEFVRVNSIEESDIIIGFFNKAAMADEAELLPGMFDCNIRCIKDDSYCEDCSTTVIATAPYPQSNRYPEVIFGEVENASLENAIGQGVLPKDFWKYIFLFNDYKWKYTGPTFDIADDEYDLETVLYHEIGHKLGVPHLEEGVSGLMVENVKSGKAGISGIRIDDIILAQSVYPEDNGKFPFFNSILISNSVLSTNDYSDTEPLTLMRSSSETAYITLEGWFMPFEMEVRLGLNSTEELVEFDRWNHEKRRFKLDLADLSQFNFVKLQVYQNQGQVDDDLKFMDESMSIPFEPGFVGYDESANEIREYALDENLSTIVHGGISMTLAPFTSAGFNGRHFSYLYLDESSGELNRYNLFEKSLETVNLGDAKLMRYTNDFSIVGIENDDLIRIDEFNGTKTVITQLPSNSGVDLSFGAAVNNFNNTYTYKDGNSDLITINFINGTVVHQVMNTSDIGLVSDPETGNFYCIENNEIKGLSVSTGQTTSLSVSNTQIVPPIILGETFFHPADNRYYYLNDVGELRGVNLITSEPVTVKNVGDLRYIQPIF